MSIANVLRSNSTWARVAGVEQHDGGATVYNFEVAQHHNYFVGEVGALVHNDCNAPTITDLNNFRSRLGIGDNRQTIALGKTDIEGLSKVVFEGASPTILKEAGLPPAVAGPIKSNIQNRFFASHAEEVLANQFVSKIEGLGLTSEQLRGKTLAIRISNPAGLCPGCSAGLKANSRAVNPGVIKQLSELYPTLNIKIFVADSSGSMLVRGGRIISE